MPRPCVSFAATVSRDPGDVEPGLSFGRGGLTENLRERERACLEEDGEGKRELMGVMNPCTMSVADSWLNSRAPTQRRRVLEMGQKGGKCSHD